MNTRIPSATYRLQLNRDFTLHDAAATVGYLGRLGISDCYVSPLTQARAGSNHGYDVTDFQSLNPEIGGREGFRTFAHAAREHGLGTIVDIVVNHMCIADPSNKWWFDVLENGPSSPFAAFFDIDWRPPKADLANKVLLPVLGEQFGQALENGRIVVAYRDGSFQVRYGTQIFPLAPRSSTAILEPALTRLTARLGETSREALELASIITALNHLPLRTETDAEKVRERQREKLIARERLSALVESSAEVRSAVETSIGELNGRRGEPRSFDRLEQLLDDQAYRLSFWHVAADEINYRRFFDVNDLAAIRVEQPEVFRAAHELILDLVREGLIGGLRIDHVDGLRDPVQYLRTLQQECLLARPAQEIDDAPRAEAGGAGRVPAVVRPFYIVVEKILGRDEPLRTDWSVHGTTGYEFLNDLNALFVDRAGGEALMEFYQRFGRQRRDFADVVYDCKKLVLRALMSGEQNVLARRLDRISEQHRWSRDFTLNSLGRVLAEVIACFPVYRSYVSGDAAVSGEDRRWVLAAINAAKRRNAALSESPFDFLASVLLLDHPEGIDDAALGERLDFSLRFQQLTSPVMAKGFEDTAIYRVHPLASLNEVGGDPMSFGIEIDAFHARNTRRLRDWPHGLSATSTHDTKRGEDVRARINVLSEIPQKWERAVRRWHSLNAALISQWNGSCAPDGNEEYFFYQTLVGAWPMCGMSNGQHADFVERVRDYMFKAAKEAKLRTSWISPNAAHDQALDNFVRNALARDAHNRFLADFVEFRRPIAIAAMLNSLSQTLIKIAAPGVPDFYQGSELWDYNLVDPDNRRPVDFALRAAMLDRLIRQADGDRARLVEDLLDCAEDGRIKMYVTHRALRYRRAHRTLFEVGEYLPLDATGERARNVIGFARRSENRIVIVATGRLFFGLQSHLDSFPPATAWSGTWLELPEGSDSRRFRDLFSGRTIETRRECDAARLSMSEVFALMPVAMLVPEHE